MSEKLKGGGRSRLRLFPSFSVKAGVWRREVAEEGGSTPVLLAVRRRGEVEVGREGRREGEERVQEAQAHFTSLPNQHKLRRQR